jgi:hypothetical protein
VFLVAKVTLRDIMGLKSSLGYNGDIRDILGSAVPVKL